MSGRPVVVDMHGGPKAIDACPSCGASLSWVRRGDLREVAFDWRAAPGHRVRTFELRCRQCNRLLVVYESAPGVISFVPDQDAALRHVRGVVRGDVADRSDRDR